MRQILGWLAAGTFAMLLGALLTLIVVVLWLLPDDFLAGI